MRITSSTTTALPAHGLPAHRRRHKKTAVATRTTGVAVTDFLKRRLPRRSHHLFAGSLQEVERRFFTSVTSFCQAHGIEQPITSVRPFPDNIKATFNALSKEWDKRKERTELFIACGEGQSGAIATIENVARTYDLYHISIHRAYELERKEGIRSPALALLLHIFAYLYHVIGFGNFNEPNIVHAAYDYLLDNIDAGFFEEQGDRIVHKEWLDQLGEEMALAMAASNWLSGHLGYSFQPERWQQALTRLQPSSLWEEQLLLFSAQFYALHRAFPGQGLQALSFPGITGDSLADGEPEDWLCVADIFSFCYIPQGSGLADEIYDYINSMSEGRYIDYTPAHLTLYGESKPQPLYDPAFATLLFALLDKFCELTN